MLPSQNDPRWRQVDARSASAAGSARDHSPSPYIHSQLASNQQDAYQGGNGAPLAAPRAVQPYPRLTSPQPLESTRSPSPSKRPQGFGFTDGLPPNERWSSLGQSQQMQAGMGGAGAGASSLQRKPQQPGMNFNANGVDVGQGGGRDGQQQQGMGMNPGQNGNGGGPQPSQQQQPQSGGQRGPEPFLGYNDLILGGGSNRQGSDRGGMPPTSEAQKAFAAAHQQAVAAQAGRNFPNEMDQYNSRFDGPPSAGYSREDGPYSAGPGGMRDQFPFGMGRGGNGNGMGPLPGGSGVGIPGLPSSGSVSPRSLLHYHHQQIQAQQVLAQQQAQGMSSQIGLMGPPPGGIGPPEEITTIFIVGFPDDMTEREFANMFLFAKGFEASTLKIPAGGPSGPEPPRGTGSTGPGGPYNQVSMHGGLFDLNNPQMGGWDDPLALAISRGNVDPLSLANLSNSLNGPQGLGPGGKIKQIIGFAKFRSRPEALEAKDALNGRKIDAERGCVLKTEMAKKNLHTKQRPVLLSSNPALPGDYGPPASVTGPMGLVGPQQPPYGMSQSHPGVPSDRDRFQPSGGPPSAGGFGSRPSNFEPFSGGALQSHPNGMLSPGAEGYSNPSGDFFGREASSFGGAAAQASRPPPDERGSGDKWTSMGPLDYYAPDSSSQQSSRQAGQSTKLPASNSYSSSNLGGWPTREEFAKHDNASRNSNSPPNGDGSEGQASGHSQQKYEEALARHQQQQMQNIQQQQQQQQFASRFNSMRLGADSPSNERPQESTDFQSHSPPSGNQQQLAFEQQQQQQQQSAQSSHPHSHAPSPSAPNATDLLQVTGFPSRPGSPEASHLEEELRHKFSEQPGFRHLSFHNSQNGGSNCLVEFTDAQSASRAMNLLNGNTLNGSIGQGIRVGFARRENQFNDFSGRDMVSFEPSPLQFAFIRAFRERRGRGKREKNLTIDLPSPSSFSSMSTSTSNSNSTTLMEVHPFDLDTLNFLEET